MRNVLIFLASPSMLVLAVAINFLIVINLLSNRIVPQLKVEEFVLKVEQFDIELESEVNEFKIEIPEPIVITALHETNLISDTALRIFVRRKANFRRDKVLFFEWKGVPGDKMTISRSPSEEKYIIDLHLSKLALISKDVVHRQVFIIPVTYSYVCRIADNDSI